MGTHWSLMAAGRRTPVGRLCACVTVKVLFSFRDGSALLVTPLSAILLPLALAALPLPAAKPRPLFAGSWAPAPLGCPSPRLRTNGRSELLLFPVGGLIP